jgi:hypothetical protein
VQYVFPPEGTVSMNRVIAAPQHRHYSSDRRAN